MLLKNVAEAILRPRQVRMQAQNEAVAKRGMFSCFMDIHRKEGIPGLWRVSCGASLLRLGHRSARYSWQCVTFPCAFQGVEPTATRAAIVVGVELPIYDVCKKYILRSGKLGDDVYTHFM